MRYWCSVLALVLLACAGCTREVAGIAQVDRHHPGAVVSADRYGVVVGFPNAPVQLEIFIEPQCPHCAEFESAYGDKLASYVSSGRLAVTYRPLTFIDDAKDNHYSARVSNALFVVGRAAILATSYQAFVQTLYQHQDSRGDGPSNDRIADMARESGVSDAVAARIEAGDSGVDVQAMDEANTTRLNSAEPDDPGTPTVYDLKDKKVVDLQDPRWLDNLFKSA
ncbi:DsbA family protein [uncultured Mycobacterium sp.]|uniref:DsbA family protein n=1 Tax=uncultured Mycobacterium sp. TaxID=171292 RepID=UPI0035C99416